MSELTATHYSKVAPNANAEAFKVMDRHFRAEHAHILTDAKAQVERKVREDWCGIFDIEMRETDDGEGGGSLRVIFPEGRGWDADSATDFATEILALDLTHRYGGPGRYFQDASVHEHGKVTVYVRWGLDI